MNDFLLGILENGEPEIRRATEIVIHAFFTIIRQGETAERRDIAEKMKEILRSQHSDLAEALGSILEAFFKKTTKL